MFRALTVFLTHAREPEGVEHVRVLVDRRVVMRRIRCSDHERIPWDEGPIIERDVFQRLAGHRGYGEEQRLVVRMASACRRTY